MHIQGKRFRIDTDRKFSSGPSRVSLMMLGLTIGLLWLQFFVARPLLREVAALKSQVGAYGRRIDQLAGTQPGVHRLQSLLGMLEAQGRQAESARKALEQIAELEQSIQRRANTTAATLRSLQQFERFAQQLEQQQQRLAAALREAPSASAPQAAQPAQTLAAATPSERSAAVPGPGTDAADVARLRQTVAQLIRDLQSLGSVAKVVHSQAAMTLQAREIADELARTQRDLKTSIDAMKRSANQLAELATSIAQLEASPKRMQAARQTVERLAALEKKLAEQREHLDDSSAALNALIALKDTLRLHHKETAQATQAANELVQLARDVADTRKAVRSAREANQETERLLADIAERRTEVQAARETADRLFRIHDRLVAATPELNRAASSLAAFDDLQRRVRSMSSGLADSLETLELLADLDGELRTQVRAIDNVRRNLMEIVLLESAVGRVARILEPLAQLVDLRRLSAAELRAAAQVVLQRRAHRLAQSPRDNVPPTDSGKSPGVSPDEAPPEPRVPAPELLDTPGAPRDQPQAGPPFGREQSSADGSPADTGLRSPTLTAAAGESSDAPPWVAARRKPSDRSAPQGREATDATTASAQTEALRTLTDGTPLFLGDEPATMPLPQFFEHLRQSAARDAIAPDSASPMPLEPGVMLR